MVSYGADGFLTDPRYGMSYRPVARARSEEHGPNLGVYAPRLPPEPSVWPVPWSPLFYPSPLPSPMPSPFFMQRAVSVGWDGQGLSSAQDHPWGDLGGVEVGRSLGQDSTHEDIFGVLNGPLDYEYLACFCIDEYDPNGPDKDNKELGQRALFHMLDALIAINEDYLRAHPELPSLYDLPIYYNPDKLRLPTGTQYEEWKSIPSILRRYWERVAQGNPDGKVADCKDFICWFCAEWRVRHGINAMPTIQYLTLPTGRQVFHIQGMLPDGTIVDVSRQKGMP